jgi:alpha-aminoadipic semialdehyde synthase
MTRCIGIRREDEELLEHRVALTPEQVEVLIKEHDIQVRVQPSEQRAISEQQYVQAGASIEENLSPCPVIFGLKEIPVQDLASDKVYIFFSHTIKGQSYNMAMLRTIMDLGCTLIDYETITDEDGRRLIFFGRHAGLAGMIDTLWVLGKRLRWEGVPNPFETIQRALDYPDLPTAKAHIAEAGKMIAAKELPRVLTPLIFGFAGYGHVSRGAQEIFELLPFQEIDPSEVFGIATGQEHFTDIIYKVVFKEEHLVEPVDPGGTFELQDYYQHPEKYRSVFSRYLDHLTVLMNCIYWDQRYPRLVTLEDLQNMFIDRPQPRLRVIGDISCDVEGAIECTVRATHSDRPVYVYEPATGESPDGWEGHGPVILAVSNLPTELPRDASRDFGRILQPYVPMIALADYSVDFENCRLPEEIKRGMIVYRGKLTPKYRYLEEYLTKEAEG